MSSASFAGTAVSAGVDAADTKPVPQHLPSLSSRDQHRKRPSRLAGITIIVALHLAALFWISQLDQVRQNLIQAAPLFVQFLPAPPVTKPDPPPPKPPVQQPRHEPRLITSPAPHPATVTVPLPDPQPAPEPPPVAAAPAPPAPPVPAPVIPPNFIAAYLDNPAPSYPPLSRRLGEAGDVLLRVRVNAGGHGEAFELQKSSGFERLDRAALDAVHQWRFVAARQGDQAVAAWVLIPIHFQLDQ